MSQPVLLHTKFLIPRFPPAHVARPHLVNMLSEYLKHRLVILTAPAGYGKTTLAAEAIRRLNEPTLWYQLDIDDNDPTTYITYLVEGLCRTLPSIGQKVQNLLLSSGPHPPQRALVILLNELVEQPSQAWVLVLDDYHVVHNPAVHSLTTFLFENQPPGMKMIIATRSQPPLTLARWRARAQLAEIRADHLRFTAQEVADWTAGSGYDLPEVLIKELVERTEGWGAGLQLALALLSESQSDPQGLFKNLNGSNPFIFNYLMEEIFDRQPAAIQNFLLQSSVLRQLNVEICQQVLLCDGASEILTALEHDNLFLVRLDHDWYRYHTLFREFLLNRLTNQWPEQLIGLYRAAAHYYQIRMQYEAATQYFLLANELSEAALTLQNFARQFFEQGRFEVLNRYLDQLGKIVLTQHPELLLLVGRIQYQLGHLNDSILILEQVRTVAADHECAVMALIELASIARSQGNYQRAQLLASEAVEHGMHSPPEIRALALMELAKCQGFLEGMDVGRALAEEAVATLRKADTLISRHPEAQLLRSLAQICWWHGDVNQAVVHCQEALHCLPDDQSPLAAHILVTLAIPMLYRHEYSVALEYAERALRTVQRLQLKELLSMTYSVLGNILTRIGQLQQAEDSLRQAIDLASTLGGASYDQVMAAGYLAYNLVAQGRVDEARQIAETALYPHRGQAMVYEIYVCRSVLADTYLDTGNRVEAEAIFDALVTIGEARQYRIPLAMAYFGLAYIFLTTNRKTVGSQYAQRSLELLTASETWELYVDQGERSRLVFDALQERNHPLMQRVYQVLNEKTVGAVSVLPPIPARIRVQTLGTLRVFQGEQEIDPRAWVSAKARDLMAYFVTFRHETIPLDRIVDALWAADLQQGKAAFHTAMYRLRHALRGVKENTKFVIVESGDYWLDLTCFDIDIDRFDEYMRQASQTHPADSIHAYQKAVGLYHGEYLNNLYYDWLLPERQRMNDLYLQALNRLGKLYVEGRQFSEALVVARQAILINPLTESIHCDIMCHLYELGDRQGIRKQYKVLETLLRDELGLKPLAETQKLFFKLMGT